MSIPGKFKFHIDKVLVSNAPTKGSIWNGVGNGFIYAPYIPVQVTNVYNPCGEIELRPNFPRKTDCLVVGEMYRTQNYRQFKVSAYKRPISKYEKYDYPDRDKDILFELPNNAIVQYLGCTHFDRNGKFLGDLSCLYKLFCDDQVGWVPSESLSLVFLKTEQEQKEINLKFSIGLDGVTVDDNK
jgi:hypothetical protein